MTIAPPPRPRGHAVCSGKRVHVLLIGLLALSCKRSDEVGASPPAPASALVVPVPAPTPASASASTPVASASTSAPLSPASASASASTAPPPSLKSFPGTEAGASSLLAEFVKPGADTAGLSAQLRPTAADYKAVFDAKTAARIDAVYSKPWDAGTFVVAPRQGQTAVLVDSATITDLKAGTGPAKDFPSGYKIVSSHLVGAARLYRFRFVEPGNEQGNAYDGLVHVNGHWVLIPKPWRALDDH